MKISELTKTWATQPRIVRVHEGETVHIVERNGEKREPYNIESRYITNCNRLLKWPNVERGWGQYRLCPTCGGEHPKQTFLDAEERGRQWKRDRNAKRDAERRLEDAERLAALNWHNLWKSLDQSIEDDLVLMAESSSGTALFPIKRADMAWLRSQINRMLACVEAKDSKTETEVRSMHRAHRLVNDVLIGD